MNRLDLEAVNSRSPYDVHSVGDQYVFVTGTGIEYHVDFELDSNPYYTAYWFNLANPEQQKSLGDKKIPQTVIYHSPLPGRKAMGSRIPSVASE